MQLFMRHTIIYENGLWGWEGRC